MDPGEIEEGRVVVRGDEAHHAAKVLRIREGERISVADGTGLVVEAVVTGVGTTVEGEVREEIRAEPPRPRLRLYQATVKGERTELAVQKAVELGVGCIVPFVGERSVVRWDAEKRRKARRRLSEIARSAAKQSRSPWLPQVEEVADGVAVSGHDDLLVVLDAGAELRLRCVLPANPPEQVGIVVGPEGGLSPGELERLDGVGGARVTLGDRILRTETAGWVAAALIGYVYGDLG